MPDVQLVPLSRGDSIFNADYRDELPVNMYTVIKKIRGSDGYLINHPGLELHAVGLGVDRGGIFSERFEKHYRVSGDSFIEVSESGSVTNISGLTSDSIYVPIPGDRFVKFAQSFNNLAIVNGTDVFYYSPSKGLRKINVDFSDEYVPPQAGVASSSFVGALSYQSSRTASGANGLIGEDFSGIYENVGVYGYIDAPSQFSLRWVRSDSPLHTLTSNLDAVYFRRESEGKSPASMVVMYGIGGADPSIIFLSSNIDYPDFFRDNESATVFLIDIFTYADDLAGQVLVPGPKNANLFGESIDIAFINGVFMMTDGSSLYHTTFADEERIDPLAFASAEFLPDRILGLEKTQDNLIAAFGRYSTEYFVANPANTFSFSRSQGLATKSGLIATNAKAEMDGSFFVLGGRREESTGIQQVAPGQAQSITTREIEKILAEYTELDLFSAKIDAIDREDTMFLYCSLPNHTLLYNHTVAKIAGLENAWTILKTGTVSSSPWPGFGAVFDPRIPAFVFGDSADSNIGILSNDVSTVYGEKQEWIVYTPFIQLDGLSINYAEIKTISGFTDKKDVVFLSLTQDGETYSREFIGSYGSPQERAKRLIWRRLGYIRGYAGFKIRGVFNGRAALGAIGVSVS